MRLASEKFPSPVIPPFWGCAGSAWPPMSAFDRRKVVVIISLTLGSVRRGRPFFIARRLWLGHAPATKRALGARTIRLTHQCHLSDVTLVRELGWDHICLVLRPSIFVPPCEPIQRDRPPKGDAWRHEVKFDGYRMQLHKAGHKVRLFTRNGHDWTERSPLLAAELAALPACIIDAELVATDEAGIATSPRSSAP
jgi:ATP dependent DNA ligase domain